MLQVCYCDGQIQTSFADLFFFFLSRLSKIVFNNSINRCLFHKMDGNFRTTLTILLLLTFNRAVNIKTCKKYGSIQNNEQIIQNMWNIERKQLPRMDEPQCCFVLRSAFVHTMTIKMKRNGSKFR